jgi:hypothetical protein
VTKHRWKLSTLHNVLAEADATAFALGDRNVRRDDVQPQDPRDRLKRPTKGFSPEGRVVEGGGERRTGLCHDVSGFGGKGRG